MEIDMSFQDHQNKDMFHLIFELFDDQNKHVFHLIKGLHVLSLLTKGVIFVVLFD